MSFSLHIGGHCRGASDVHRWAPMRAQRAKLKSRRDDKMIAQGKRSVALGYGPKTIPSLFPSSLARCRCAKLEGKREVGWGGFLPRAAASSLRCARAWQAAALPWAIILLPLRSAGKANQRAGSGGGMSVLLRTRRRPPAAPQHERWATAA
jgi:hypothetical protein